MNINKCDQGNLEDDQDLLMCCIYSASANSLWQREADLAEQEEETEEEKEDEMQIPLGTQAGYLVQGREFPIRSEKTTVSAKENANMEGTALTCVCQKWEELTTLVSVWKVGGTCILGAVAIQFALVNWPQN